MADVLAKVVNKTGLVLVQIIQNSLRFGTDDLYFSLVWRISISRCPKGNQSLKDSGLFVDSPMQRLVIIGRQIDQFGLGQGEIIQMRPFGRQAQIRLQGK